MRSVTVRENLIIAKSKVDPLKSLTFFLFFFSKIKINTIPKLELCAAVLLCKLVKFYRDIVSETVLEMLIFAETDSTVSQTSPHLLMTFIPNRIATIQDIIE